MNHMDGLSFVIVGVIALWSVAFNGVISTILWLCAGFGIASLLMPLFP